MGKTLQDQNQKETYLQGLMTYFSLLSNTS